MLMVAVSSLPLMGLISVMDGVILGDVTVEIPVCGCGLGEVSALWKKVYPSILYVSGVLM